MLDYDVLFRDLDRIGLRAWRATLEPLLAGKFAAGAHGHLAAWREVLDGLPSLPDQPLDLESAAVSIGDETLPAVERDRIGNLLRRLVPWRKGPFCIHGIDLDAEWRSDLKWNRLKGELTPLTGRVVLDVGCGNGYYALRMLGAGAALVVGIDPTLLFVCQFLALKKLSGVRAAHVLPLRLDELPAGSRTFDTTFSMGVLYHRRDPMSHLQELRDTLRGGGELVLETLVIADEDPRVLEPAGRYARMRNVWHLPSVPTLRNWLSDAGFDDVRCVDVTVTSQVEQRTTDWMPYESLAEALDPGNPALTVEGLPAPARAILVAKASRSRARGA